MVLNLLGLSRVLRKPAPVERAALPDGQRVYAIGDVHGCLGLLDDLLRRIDADDAARGPAETTLVFLGDLIDRGPDSRGVVERAMQLAASGGRVRFLKGNHEEMFLAAIESDRGESMSFFLRNGGRETLLSYPVGEEEYEHGTLADLRELARERVPQEHRDFLAGFEDMIAIGDYVFVHAGIRPGVPLGEQAATDLRWIRREFLESRRDHGAVIVHGHSIRDAAEICPNRIGIDTGAFDSGVLTAIGLEGDARWFLATGPDADDARGAFAGGSPSRANSSR